MQSQELTIGVLGMGTMGSAVASSYRAAGHRVLTDLTGRRAMSVKRAADLGIEAAQDLRALAAHADVLFSIVPPAAARDCAMRFADAAGGLERPPLFVDANAVSPETTRHIAGAFDAAGLPFVDGGIVGAPPGGRQVPILYLSGPRARALDPLDGQAFRHRVLDDRIGSASAFKMLYAGLTKGINALIVCQLIAAERLGLLDGYIEVLEEKQSGVLADANRIVPRMPADAGRWVEEMHEIADTLAAVDLPREFHTGAAAIMERLAASPFSGETRETVDRARTLRDTIRAL